MVYHRESYVLAGKRHEPCLHFAAFDRRHPLWKVNDFFNY